MLENLTKHEVYVLGRILLDNVWAYMQFQAHQVKESKPFRIAHELCDSVHAEFMLSMSYDSVQMLLQYLIHKDPELGPEFKTYCTESNLKIVSDYYNTRATENPTSSIFCPIFPIQEICYSILKIMQTIARWQNPDNNPSIPPTTIMYTLPHHTAFEFKDADDGDVAGNAAFAAATLLMYMSELLEMYFPQAADPTTDAAMQCIKKFKTHSLSGEDARNSDARDPLADTILECMNGKYSPPRCLFSIDPYYTEGEICGKSGHNPSVKPLYTYIEQMKSPYAVLPTLLYAIYQTDILLKILNSNSVEGVSYDKFRITEEDIFRETVSKLHFRTNVKERLTAIVDHAKRIAEHIFAMYGCHLPLFFDGSGKFVCEDDLGPTDPMDMLTIPGEEGCSVDRLYSEAMDWMSIGYNIRYQRYSGPASEYIFLMPSDNSCTAGDMLFMCGFLAETLLICSELAAALDKSLPLHKSDFRFVKALGYSVSTDPIYCLIPSIYGLMGNATYYAYTYKQKDSGERFFDTFRKSPKKELGKQLENFLDDVYKHEYMLTWGMVYIPAVDIYNALEVFQREAGDKNEREKAECIEIERAGRSKELNAKVGRNVSFFRLKSGMSQSELAKAMGMSSSTLSRIERGTSNISLGKLAKISTACGIPTGDLFTPDIINRGYISDS